MVLSTTLAGVFMFGVHGLGAFLGAASYGLFLALLGLVNFSTILSPGIQTVFAYETADAKSENDRLVLGRNVVGVLGFLTVLWVAIVLLVLPFQGWVLAELKIPNRAVLWVTLLVMLPHLWLPVLMGVLQGRQLFGWLGWAVIANGLGRFGAVALILVVMGGMLHWLMLGPLVGVLLAVCLSGYCCRDLFRRSSDRLEWKQWLYRAVPFALGPGIFQVFLTADSIIARASFSEIESGHYGAASLAGRGLVMFVGPLAGVMFPKLVRETSDHQGARLVRDTALATAFVVGLAVTAAFAGSWAMPSVIQGALEWESLSPELRAGFETKSAALIWIARLAPWFLAAMGPLAVANVFMSHLVANRRFRMIAGLLGVVGLYGVGLVTISFSVQTLVFWVGLGNGTLLAAAFLLSQRLRRESANH